MKQFKILQQKLSQGSIRNRLMIWFLLFSLLPLAIVGYFSYSTASGALQAEVEEKLSGISLNNLDKIDRILLERFADLRVWSTLELSRMAVEIGSGTAGASEFVNYLITQYKVYSLILLVDREGFCVTVNTVNKNNEPLPGTEAFLGKNFSKQPWFTNALQHEDVVVTDWHQVELLNMLASYSDIPQESTYSMIFSSAIRDVDGRILGVWANVINWKIFQEILSQIHAELPEVTTPVTNLLLLADNDTIIAYSGLQFDKKTSFYGKSLSNDLQQPQLANILAEKQGVFPYNWDGKPKTIVLSREKGFGDYPGNNWGYLLIADNISTYAQIISLRSKIIMLGALSSIVILLLVYIIGHRLAAPLVLLSDTAAAIADGDLTRRIAIPVPEVQSAAFQDEVGMLLYSFRQMTENLHRLIQEIKEASKSVSKFSNQISEALQQLSEVSTQQSSAIVETTATVEEFATTSREIAKSADTVATFAEITEQEAHKGVKAAVDTLTRIQAIKQANDENMQHVMSLNERSKEINEIVEAITNIADTTDLIAFNAALEAAGAGEKGKRFGVVASEIRRLANTVATSVKSIHLKISDIQNGVRTLVSAFETETDRIEYGVADMKVTAAALDSILAKIERTTASLMQISSSTKQQQISNEQIVKVLQHMSQETMNFQAIAHQTLNITTELNRLAKELQHTVNVFQVEGG